MNQDTSRELDPEEVALVEHAKRIMQQDLNQVHTKGRTTDYFQEESVAFLVATAAYSMGNVLVAVESLPGRQDKMKKLVLEAVNSIKALHLAMRIGAEPSNQYTGRVPGDPPGS